MNATKMQREFFFLVAPDGAGTRDINVEERTARKRRHQSPTSRNVRAIRTDDCTLAGEGETLCREGKNGGGTKVGIESVVVRAARKDITAKRERERNKEQRLVERRGAYDVEEEGLG